jgi:threonine aldolase
LKTVDLRSDTVTRPTEAMRAAMAAAEVGDDVYGEDPTIHRLETKTAKMLGTEAAIFATSGTQSNLLALLSHCQRGEEYIVGQHAHTYRYEGGGAAVLGSIQPQPLDFDSRGRLDLDQVKAMVKPDDFHFARTRLLCLENTQAGKVLPMPYLAQARRLSNELGLSTHLDGARIFNAAVKLNVDVAEIAQYFDTISVCLSKGLGAPVGSVLCGPRDLIDRARRWRKMLGGGMRQAGILAAAGLVALDRHVGRLADDHANAKRLAHGLARIDAVTVDPEAVDTNMVFIEVDRPHAHDLNSYLKQRGILVDGDGAYRLVTHLDVDSADVDRAVDAIQRFFSGRPQVKNASGKY